MPQLNYKIYGTGYPVIILHGLFGSLDNWHSFAKKLSTDYMVYTIDQRDHGRSPKTDDFSYELLADDLRQFMEEQWIYEAIIIGHSMGGKTLMRFALDYPDMLSKGIVIDIAPQAYKPKHIRIIEALKSIDINAVSSRTEIQNQLFHSIPNIGIVNFLMKNFSRRKEGGFELKINLSLLSDKYTEINKEITGETSDVELLFVKGAQSDYLSEKEDSFIDLFPNARLTTIDDAGHWVHAEQPDKLLEVIVKFIS